MKHKQECIMGMKLDVWNHKSCEAEFGVGDNWATLYLIESSDKRKNHAQELLVEAKKYYENLGFRFGGSVALNSVMKHIYEKLKIKEYGDIED